MSKRALQPVVSISAMAAEVNLNRGRIINIEFSRKENTSMKIKTNVKAGVTNGHINVGD
jgi:hypothetical protein